MSSIRDYQRKKEEIIRKVENDISRINDIYRQGPSYYFYKRIIEMRENHPTIQSFLSDNYNTEILYATLASWDMNTRAAKMKNYGDFKNNLESCINELSELERSSSPLSNNDHIFFDYLKKAYIKLEVMDSGGRIVSNSKILHFLFPSLCMPTDKSHCLEYIYGNLSESPNKYIEIIQFSFDIIRNIDNPDNFLDDKWNTTVPKMIDNAIILITRNA